MLAYLFLDLFSHPARLINKKNPPCSFHSARLPKSYHSFFWFTNFDHNAVKNMSDAWLNFSCFSTLFYDNNLYFILLLHLLNYHDIFHPACLLHMVIPSLLVYQISTNIPLCLFINFFKNTSLLSYSGLFFY